LNEDFLMKEGCTHNPVSIISHKISGRWNKGEEPFSPPLFSLSVNNLLIDLVYYIYINQLLVMPYSFIGHMQKATTRETCPKSLFLPPKEEGGICRFAFMPPFLPLTPHPP